MSATGLCRRVWQQAAWLLLVVAALLAWGTPTLAGEPVVRAAADVFDSERVDLSGAKPVKRAARDVAVGHAVETDGVVRPVAYYEGEMGYGPAVFESSCGCETVCDCPAGDVFMDPGCGIEASCGFEASCGAETWIEPACGCEGVGCDACCDGYDPMCGCNACCGGIGGFIDCLFPRLRIQWAQLDLFAGVAGHTGPMNFANVSSTGTDRRGTGSFGFYEGFNKGTAVRFFGADLAWQSGVRFTQNNLSGAGFTDETRGQVFLTSGIFRTVDYGFQYGLVLDYLYEDWYYRSDLVQLRGELGWVNRGCNVFGLKFAVGIDDDTATTSVLDNSGTVVRNDIAMEAMTQYRLFYRQRLARLGSCEGFVGWTDNDDGLLGMELDLPIHGNLLWNTSATYLIPNEGTSSGGNQEEGWNLAIGFTYRPGGLGGQSRYSRPLLKVADNGTLMVDRK
ncbi:hypothetical protein NZK35_29510 [Stieleria sp. ICT_E10.1]|uniref:DUF6666 family protein n=1 Tax=Stieleria sedimenti TaxID=2976331 RepID=UPI00217FF215|nr:DUF6666 family protein [Stieleria sedimenti]MCS7470811.1 hypothetical protein [Stieleria sedimenti]